MTKLYKDYQPYGRITVLHTGKRYKMMSPTPLQSDDWAEYAGMQTWSVISLYDGFNHEEMEKAGAKYSSETHEYYYNHFQVLIVHPRNIVIELIENMKPVKVWTGEEMEEPEVETELDLSEDENYLMPDYLLDVAPVEYEQPVMYLDDGFPV